MLGLAQDLARYSHTMHTTASANLIYVANGIANAVVIQAYPVLQLDTLVVIAVVNLSEIAACQQNCQLC